MENAIAREVEMTLTETISLLGSENTDIHGGTFNGGLRLQQNPAELAWMIEKLRGIEPFWLYGEIGIGSGGTCRAIRQLAQPRWTIVIDDRKQPYSAHIHDNLGFNLSNHLMIVGNSHSLEVKRELEFEFEIERFDPFDAILIDGDHSFAGVEQDIELVRPYCRPDTLLFFHDVALHGWPGCEVPRFWKESKLIKRLDQFIAPPSKSGYQMGLGMAVLA